MNGSRISKSVMGVVLVTFMAISVLFTAMVYADWSGNCKRDGAGLCKNPGAACTIVVDGVSKVGKCKSHAYGIGGFCVCTPNDGTKVQETSGKAKTPAVIPPAPALKSFGILEGDAESMYLLPEEFGGEVILTSSISGSITLQSFPSGNPDIDIIEIVSGTLEISSMDLPNGESTGLNTFEFLSPGETQGTLDRITGEFYFPANGRLTNDLFPSSNPIPTLGDYFGTVDMATGEVWFDTRTFDFVPDSPIPTLSEWGMIIFAVALLGLMTYVVIKRRKAAQATAI